MAAAIRQFLIATGLKPSAPQLRETPRRVAEAWLEDFVDGYAKDPKDVLADVYPAASRAMVIAKRIDFHSMCPHHLIPYRGVAHVAYVPAKAIVGFGRLVDLVDAISHRLILQEEIADEIVLALTKHLKARGAACVLDAEQGCVTMRGPKRRGTRTVTQSFRGVFARDRRLQDRFLRAIQDRGSRRS